MGTDINIKKRIAIQEESVTITSDVNSINFIGDGVTASAIGDDVTVNIPGGMGNVTYYLNETVTQAPYKEFSSFPTGAVEQTILTTIGAGATSTIQSFQTPSGIPGTTNIPAGLWSFYLHFSGTGANTFNIYVEVYKRDLGGIETLLLTTDSVSVTPGVTPAMTLTDGVFPASTVLTTDRIVVKVKAQNTEATPSPITFHTEGSTNYSVSTTTLNQVVPGGTVTSVTGTAPIASSGGTTPAISISQSGAASDGYLSSTDWNTFNNKVDDNIYTANGTLAGNRTVDLNSNTLTFSNGIVNFNQGTTNSGEIRLYEDADFGGNYIALRAPQSFGSDISLFLPGSLGTNGQVLTTNGLGVTSWTTVGLTYFTEAQSTAAPNATVNVDSLTAVASTANADIALVPKGTGAFTLAVADNTATGGNKRGANAIDLQTSRTINTSVASGVSSVAIGVDNRAAGLGSVAIGRSARADGQDAVAIGPGAQATNNECFVFGNGSIASGAFGAVALGRSNTSSGDGTLTAGFNNVASGSRSVALGESNTASANGAVALGVGVVASGIGSIATGWVSNTFGIRARQSHGNQNTVSGDCQKSVFTLSVRTTNNTATTLTVGGGAASTTNQVILSNNAAYAFEGKIIGKQSGSTNAAMWKVEGLIVRGANAASTVLTASTVTLFSNLPGWGTPTLAADTTNGGLQIQVAGIAATNIQWTAVIETTEVIYA